VVVTGARGFIGRHLTPELGRRGDRVTALSRSPDASAPGAVEFAEWQPDSPASLEHVIRGADAVVHLMGAPAVGVRWDRATKQRIHQSRVESTRQLGEAMARAEPRPRTLLSASAVGYYGPGPADVELDERAPRGAGFLAELAGDWEDAARRVSQLGVRVVLARFGLVLGTDGGALPELSRPLRWYVGGPLGTGEQIVSWIHVDDAVRALLFCLDHESVQGPVNFTAPHPASQAELLQTLGGILRRPVWLPVPAWLLGLRFGEGAEPLVTGQRVRPRVLEAQGFEFCHPRISGALADLFGRVGGS
jgi:uncharacterized protein (TIGR01777 family)